MVYHLECNYTSDCVISHTDDVCPCLGAIFGNAHYEAINMVRNIACVIYIFH